jgi:hypothetical protein
MLARTRLKNSVRKAGKVMESAEVLRAREEEVGREWEWLQEAINLVARANTGEEDADAFRLLQHHAMDIGQRRVELMLELAALERNPRQGNELTGGVSHQREA